MTTTRRRRYSDGAKRAGDARKATRRTGVAAICATVAACVAVAGSAALSTAEQTTGPSSAIVVDWSVADGLSRAVADQPPRQRKAIRLGVDGDAPLFSPVATGRRVANRDAIAALSSDQALASAATFGPAPVRALAPPIEDERAVDRVAVVRESDRDTQERLNASQEAGFDVALAGRLNTSFLGGVDRMAAEDAEEEKACLAEAIYFEARSEPLSGQVAVAEVVLNRVDSDFWPDTICGVVNQGSHRRTGCQFSYTCDGLPETIGTPRAWELALRVAQLMMQGAPRLVTNHATHYHADYVDPRWARAMEKTTVVGRHIFYRRLIRFATKGEDE